MVDLFPFQISEVLLNAYDFIGEYFFGKETKEFNEKEREFYTEFTSSKKSYEEYLKRNIRTENIGLIFGRAIPNMVSLFGIAASFKYDNLAPFFMLTVPSEAWRNIIMQFQISNRIDRKVKMGDLEEQCKKSNCINIDGHMKFLDKDALDRYLVDGEYFEDNFNDYDGEDGIVY